MGPLLGGILYEHFGFRGPIILGIIVTAVDLIGRLLIIERKDALKWGIDPAASSSSKKEQIELGEVTVATKSEKDGGSISRESAPRAVTEVPLASTAIAPIRHAPLSLIGVVRKLARSPRALAVMLNVLVYG